MIGLREISSRSEADYQSCPGLSNESRVSTLSLLNNTLARYVVASSASCEIFTETLYPLELALGLANENGYPWTETADVNTS